MGSPAYGAYKYEYDVKSILSYSSLGPKNYSLLLELLKENKKTKKWKKVLEEVVKVRGFSLNSKKSKSKLNHIEMSKAIHSFLRNEACNIILDTFQMRPQRKRQTICNKIIQKVYRNSGFDKRMILEKRQENNPSIYSVPFGAKHLYFQDIM